MMRMYREVRANGNLWWVIADDTLPGFKIEGRTRADCLRKLNRWHRTMSVVGRSIGITFDRLAYGLSQIGVAFRNSALSIEQFGQALRLAAKDHGPFLPMIGMDKEQTGGDDVCRKGG